MDACGGGESVRRVLRGISGRGCWRPRVDVDLFRFGAVGVLWALLLCVVLSFALFLVIGVAAEAGTASGFLGEVSSIGVGLGFFGILLRLWAWAVPNGLLLGLLYGLVLKVIREERRAARAEEE